MALLLPLAAAAAPAGPALTLDQAIEQARRHPRLAQARSAAAGEQARVAQAFAGWLPSVAVGVGVWGANSAGGPEPGQPIRESRDDGAHGFFAVFAGLTQTLWDFGRTANQLAAARAGARAASQEAEVVWADVELAVRIAYYNALAAAERLRIADETVATLEKRLSAARMLVEVGKRPPFDVTKSRIDLSNGRVAKLEAASSLSEGRLALAAAIGVDDLGDVRLERPIASDWKDPEFADVVSHALARRPELRSLESRVAAQKARLRAQRSQYWPSLTGGAQLSTRGVDPPEGVVAPSWQVGVQLTVPLLAGGRDLARVREQEAVLQALAAARSALVLQMRVEAQQLVTAVSTARARLEAAEAIVIQSRENLAIADERYNAGVANIIELADAQTTRTAADAQHARAEYDLAVARARLQRALGR
jgi:outer membrane protein